MDDFGGDGKYKKCPSCKLSSIREKIDRISPPLDNIRAVDPKLYRVTLDRGILKRISGQGQFSLEELEKESEAIKKEVPELTEDTELPKKLRQLQSDFSKLSKEFDLLTDDIVSLLLPIAEDGEPDRTQARKISLKLASVSEALTNIVANETQTKDGLESSIKTLLTNIFID